MIAHSLSLCQALARWVNPVLSAFGALFGIAGTAVLALEPTQVVTVLLLYIVSNSAWIAVAIRTHQWWLLTMNSVYLSPSFVGLVR